MAHELVRALFHYQDRGLVSRTRDPVRTEHFADVFAAHVRRLRRRTRQAD